jgi:hypothetical protein
MVYQESTTEPERPGIPPAGLLTGYLVRAIRRLSRKRLMPCCAIVPDRKTDRVHSPRFETKVLLYTEVLNSPRRSHAWGRPPLRN